jgi:SAM-dependent methyltransferase
MLDSDNLLEFLACPDCRTELQSFSVCAACGIFFDSSGDTPSLFPQKADRTVSFQFTPSRSTAGEDFHRAFGYPSRSGASSPDNPYHLDLAHLDVLESLTKGSTVLEIGCGGGQMRSWVTQKGYRYIGTDISKSRVHDFLKEHGGPDLLCDAHFLPFRDQKFDLVYSSAVTEHLACPALVSQEVYRVLKPGGYYLGNVSFLEPWHDDSFFHMTPLGAYENLVQAGLNPIHIWPGQGYHGFGAIMRMGNKATKSIAFAGSVINAVYRMGNSARNLVKNQPERLLDTAKVAGAVDWIAQKS